MAIANISGNILTDSGVATSSLLPLTGGTLSGDLTITKSSDTSFIANNTSASGKSYRLVSKDDGKFYIQNTGVLDLVTFTSSGNVGIGTSSPTTSYGFQKSLVVSSSSNCELSLEAPGYGKVFSIGVTGTMNYFQTTAGNGYDFQIGGSSKFLITSAGYLVSSMTYGNTTANAANMVISTGGTFERSTSSIRYKTNVEDLTIDTTSILLKMRPIWYRSLGENDRKDWSWYGFIAEELAEIEPRLVQWGYDSISYEQIEVTDEQGIVKQETKLKKDAELIPDGVQYERITVLLVAELQKQNKIIQELSAKVSALENKS